jgi:predicted O-methyltransferase YrrM
LPITAEPLKPPTALAISGQSAGAASRRNRGNFEDVSRPGCLGRAGSIACGVPRTDRQYAGDRSGAERFSHQGDWFPDITGWFSCAEALHLYTATKLARPRRILEIGMFYERSTATICAAIKSAKALVRFVTIDLDLRSEEQVRKTFGKIHGVLEISMPVECQEAFGRGLSTTAYAQHQIEKHGLAQFVNFQPDNFRQVTGKFDFVFVDVLHEANEIRQNLAAIVAKIEPGGFLAAHDLNDENKSLIDSLLPAAEFISRSGTLGIYRMSDRGTRPTKC